MLVPIQNYAQSDHTRFPTFSLSSPAFQPAATNIPYGMLAPSLLVDESYYPLSPSFNVYLVLPLLLLVHLKPNIPLLPSTHAARAMKRSR